MKDSNQFIGASASGEYFLEAIGQVNLSIGWIINVVPLDRDSRVDFPAVYMLLSRLPWCNSHTAQLNS